MHTSYYHFCSGVGIGLCISELPAKCRGRDAYRLDECDGDCSPEYSGILIFLVMGILWNLVGNSGGLAWLIGNWLCAVSDGEVESEVGVNNGCIYSLGSFWDAEAFFAH